MKIVVQRSGPSKVEVHGHLVSQIEMGLVLLVCMEDGDLPTCLKSAADKIIALRIFEDESGKMNKSISEIGGEILAISQFTLSWDGKKGNRPSFDRSMKPELALKMFDEFCKLLSAQVTVKKGQFGESMKVSITNDGPVTFSLSF